MARRKNPDGWIACNAVKIDRATGKVHVMSNPGRLANISQGYMAGGVFHPIRSADDYDPKRAGETSAARKRKKKKVTGKKRSTVKKAATKRTKRRVAKKAPIKRRKAATKKVAKRRPAAKKTTKRRKR